MPEELDLIVIGTGASGSSIAHSCAEAGWKVAIADSREPGGTCALRGCSPKKVLVNGARVVDEARRAHGYLADIPEVNLDWRQLVEFEHTFTDSVPEKTLQSLSEAGIDFVAGTAVFTAPDRVRVNDREFQPRIVVLATGARPARLDIEGEEFLTTSDEFLDLEELPRRILFVGAGYISFELAHVAARAGRDVTIAEAGKRALTAFDEDIVERLVAATREAGITVEFEAALEGLARGADGAVTARLERLGEREYDIVVHGGGRTPNLEALELETGGVAATRDGVTVDSRMRSTTNERVFAVGDCAAGAGPMLTPAAEAAAHAVGLNLLHGSERSPDVEGIPAVVFTIPPIAMAGMTEKSARERGLDFDVRSGDMSGWSSVRKVRGDHAAFKVLVEKETDRLLGAHLFGPNADETINLFSLAMRADVGARELETSPFAFPTFGYDVRAMVARSSPDS